MKYLKKLNIDFNNWEEIEKDIKSNNKSLFFMYYNSHVMDNGYRLCTIMKLNYSGLDTIFNVWDIDNREDDLYCYADYIDDNGLIKEATDIDIIECLDKNKLKELKNKYNKLLNEKI